MRAGQQYALVKILRVRMLTQPWSCQGSVVWVPFGAAYWPAQIVGSSQRCKNRALVQLFASGVSTEVDMEALTCFADGYEQQCNMMHSQLGQEVTALLCTRSFTHSHIHSLRHSLTRSFICLFTT